MQPDLAAQQFCVRIELLLTVDDQLLRDDAQSISCHSFIELHAAYLVIRKVDSANVDQRIWKKKGMAGTDEIPLGHMQPCLRCNLSCND